MNDRQVGKLWDGNADAWTQLARAGYDVYRDHLNTPAFLEMLPPVIGLSGVDIGCGEGHNTRLVAARGGRVTALDISGRFVRHAVDLERREPLGVGYSVASALELPFPRATFDFATAFMSFMDIPDAAAVLAEAHRVLKPDGFLQFSICHPCFTTPHRRNLRNEAGKSYAVEVGDYFRNLDGDIEEWIFGAAPEEARAGLSKFKIPRFTRTLSQWLNLLIDAGFTLERVGEPCPDDDAVRDCPHVQDAQVVAYYLHIRVRKPLAAVRP
jgi:SAM-dependent methyltransferase